MWGWNYGTPSASGDLSTTQFAVAGLSAAANVIDGADVGLPNVVNFLMAGQNADGGSGYRPKWIQFVAEHFVVLPIGSIPAGDPRV